jgi:hypothetical protein
MSKLPEGTAAAFNQWMQDYLDNPEKFQREWESIRGFLDTLPGGEPDYGQSCVAVLERLLLAQEAVAADEPEPRPVTPSV